VTYGAGNPSRSIPWNSRRSRARVMRNYFRFSIPVASMCERRGAMTTIEPERRFDQNEIETYWASAAKAAEPGSQARITTSRDYLQPTVPRFRTEPVNCFD
jgi:hypothetical protein